MQLIFCSSLLDEGQITVFYYIILLYYYYILFVMPRLFMLCGSTITCSGNRCNIVTALCLVWQGFLAASPDGLVGRDGLVEVKCPLRCATMSVAELTRQDNSFCLQVDIKRTASQNKAHRLPK